VSDPSDAWLKMSREDFDRHFAALEAAFTTAHTEEAFVAAFAPFAEQIFAHAEEPGKKLGILMFHLLRGVTEGYWWGKDGGQS
jgi:hypothetical protein